MPKRTKDQKRKAKLKERRRHIENAFHEQGNQLAHALEVLCEPIRDKYLDPAKISDLEGYKVAYSIGLYAWNICVSGRTGPTRNALRGHINNPDQLATMEKDIGDLIRRKYELYPGNTTAICDVVPVIRHGAVHAKIRVGKTFPPIPQVKWEQDSNKLSAEEFAGLRKKMKLTQVKFGALFGVSARKISEWEHGKSSPTEEQTIALNELGKRL